MQENVRPLLGNLIERHEVRVRALMENPKIGHYFRALMLQHEKNNERPPSLFLEGESSIISVQQAEKERRMRDIARRGDNRAVMDLDEESYFNEDEEEGDSSSGQVKDIPLSATKTIYRRSDDDIEEEKTFAKDIDAKVLEKQGPHSKPIESHSSLEFLPQKRKKRDLEEDDKEDEDGMMGRLAKRKSISTVDDDDTAGGFIKEEEILEQDDEKARALAPSKRLSINLTPDSEKMVKKAA